jgi:predicted nucleic acid-binding protein
VAELLVDTDVFVNHLRGFRALEPRRDSIHYSVVTRCELFAGPAEHEERVRELLSAFREIAVDGAIAELAGRLRRETGIRTPDALIAATARARRLVLMTRNARDFERVPKLRIKAPA